MSKKYKCPYCDERYEREKLIDHVEEEHEDLIPEHQTPTQVVFNSINKKDHGTCIVCKKPTKWNEKAGRYDRLCTDPKCRQKMREDFKRNAVAKDGTYVYTADPKFQEKMLKGRKISSTYKFTDGGKVDYVGSYEKKFLEFIDKVMNIESKDIMAPGPTIQYKYNGETHYWITDFYYISGNLVLDIKDGGKNPNNRPMQEYREKQIAKETAIKEMKKYNYLRLTDNNFEQFMEVLADLKYMALDLKERQLINNINESVSIEELSAGMSTVPPVYSSDASVLKAVDNETKEERLALSSLDFNDSILIDDPREGIKKINKKYYKDNFVTKVQFLYPKDEAYYNLLKAYKENDPCIYEGIYANLSSFNTVLTEDQIYFDNKFKLVGQLPLQEMQDKVKEVNNAITRIGESTLIRYDKIGNLLNENVDSSTFENISGSFKQKVYIDKSTKEFVIKGINFNKFLLRVREMYNHRGMNNLFDKNYSWWSNMMWKKEKISRNKMKIVNMRCPLFFALEIYKIFLDLGEEYNLKYYKRVAYNIYKKTWISKYENAEEVNVPLDNLKKLRYNLKDYQLEFVKEYPNLKAKYDLEGYILSFEQGLGKTLTSIALAEVLNKDQVIIVCPNTLKENWANEIREYYKLYTANPNIFKDEVYVLSNPKFTLTKNTKFMIINQESISKIYIHLKPNRNTMIIVDESHNFRNYNSKRTTELLKLKELTKCTDVLMMSGTPIKASPSEIVPALRMIDSYFTNELADKYTKTFNANTTEISRIVKERFDRTIYRKTKSQVLKLPDKHISDLKFKIRNESDYYVSTLKRNTNTLFKKFLEEEYKKIPDLQPKFESLVRKYSTADKNLTNGYLAWIRLYIVDDHGMNLHEHRLEIYNKFLEEYVYNNDNLDLMTRKEIEELNSKYVNIKNVAMGKAIGKVFPVARAKCYSDIIKQNTKQIVDLINSNTKKTVIFTPYLQVVDTIYNTLEDNGIGCVKIVGETDRNRRIDYLIDFKESDTVDVLIATTQTLSTGVTLTEANQMLFFGMPFRSADFEQACDRIHRIGQTTDVYIYKVLLDSDKKNITNRLDDILKWSGSMVNSIIESTNTGIIYDINDFYNELKSELESSTGSFFMIKPSNDKEDLDKQFQKYNAQNDDQKHKADTRSFALYGMNNYDHYHILLSKIKKGTEDDELDGLEYNPHDEKIVKEDGSIYDFSKDKDIKEFKNNIEFAKEFNMHTTGRVIIYPTHDANELEALYMKYMALEPSSRAASDSKTKELFGAENREIYNYCKEYIIKPKNDEIEGTHTATKEVKNTKTSSIFANDTPLLTPSELSEVKEDYSCFNIEEANIIKQWREKYISLNEEGYRDLNIKRLNILRKGIYKNNIDMIIQCGWIPGIEFNSENRVKASKLVKDKLILVNEGKIVKPEKCTKCGSTNIGVFIQGEPIFKCKDCGEYLGTVPRPTKESYIEEAKSFPVQFDKDGNLIIKNIRKINFEQEYSDSHRLLMEYDKTKAYEPMKFELAKMQFFITLLEKRIYKQGKEKSKDEIKVRARFLNDFKKYLKIVVDNDNTFNFGEYYEKSPFNDALIKIDNNTLKYGWKALKYMIK